jgi:ATP-dependent Lhr-like helicase
VFVHHSAVSREERTLAEERFHHGSDACIVCTSTLELGIDVGDLDRVLQAEAPTPSARSCSAWAAPGAAPARPPTPPSSARPPRASSRRSRSSSWRRPAGSRPVASQRPLLARARAPAPRHVARQRRRHPEDAWQHLSRVPDFSGIHRAEFDRLIAWMLRDKLAAAPRRSPAHRPRRAERRFGRRNFMELYAVFSSPQSYSVETTRQQPLGTLNQGFVDRLVEGVSCFLLSGRPWAVLHDPPRRSPHRRRARPARPSADLGRHAPELPRLHLCAKIREILAADDVPQYLTPEAAAASPSSATGMAGLTDPAAAGSSSATTRSAGGPSPAAGSTAPCATPSRRCTAAGRSCPTTS